MEIERKFLVDVDKMPDEVLNSESYEMFAGYLNPNDKYNEPNIVLVVRV